MAGDQGRDLGLGQRHGEEKGWKEICLGQRGCGGLKRGHPLTKGRRDRSSACGKEGVEGWRDGG
jgi:hypothetical protein